ncbi:flagellar basal body rod protein FlgC [bacterium]|nr:flagellar basal body rod protein FlgC [bacterium]MBU0899635.1 flagellar basal body rod protein FlgC [bacterium]MBU1153159.1 flagellar basal body rod protein FlgC [bacterium]MBU1782304.1 flagellar basal body rod protein FlgC [bacterium]
MKMFSAIDTSASGLTAESLRMDVIANNIANVNTTRTPQGGPYKRHHVIFEPRGTQSKFTLPFSTNKTNGNLSFEVGNGVKVVKVEEVNLPPRLEYQPGHTDADKNGYLHLPNINVVMEMTDLITASRAYEANSTVIKSFKTMMYRTLQRAM